MTTALLAACVLCGADAATAGESVDYLYRLHCSGCHGVDGTGSKVGRIPPFQGIVGHFATSPDGRLYLVHVPGVANAALLDAETADLLNYVLKTWCGSDADTKRAFTAEEVHSLREVHVDDVAELRRKGVALRLERGGSVR